MSLERPAEAVTHIVAQFAHVPANPIANLTVIHGVITPVTSIRVPHVPVHPCRDVAANMPVYVAIDPADVSIHVVIAPVANHHDIARVVLRIGSKSGKTECGDEKCGFHGALLGKTVGGGK